MACFDAVVAKAFWINVEKIGGVKRNKKRRFQTSFFYFFLLG
jgi:hypothetical protein